MVPQRALLTINKIERDHSSRIIRCWSFELEGSPLGGCYIAPLNRGPDRGAHHKSPLAAYRLQCLAARLVIFTRRLPCPWPKNAKKWPAEARERPRRLTLLVTDDPRINREPNQISEHFSLLSTV